MNRPPRLLLVGLGVGLALGAAGPSAGQVPDGWYHTNDPSLQIVRASVRAKEGRVRVSIGVYCDSIVVHSDRHWGDPAQGSIIQIYTSHPDRVRLWRNRALVRQRQSETPIVLSLLTGSGTGRRVNYLVCSQAKISGRVLTRDAPGVVSFATSGKSCTCVPSEVGDCSQIESQIEIVTEHCADQAAFPELFEFSTKGIERFRIRGKGEAIVFPNSRPPDSDRFPPLDPFDPAE
jgi:hypothetical protein